MRPAAHRIRGINILEQSAKTLCFPRRIKCERDEQRIVIENANANAKRQWIYKVRTKSIITIMLVVVACLQSRCHLNAVIWIWFYLCRFLCCSWSLSLSQTARSATANFQRDHFDFYLFLISLILLLFVLLLVMSRQRLLLMLCCCCCSHISIHAVVVSSNW